MIVGCDQSWDENEGCALIRCLKRGSTCMLERGNEKGAPMLDNAYNFGKSLWAFDFGWVLMSL